MRAIKSLPMVGEVFVPCTVAFAPRAVIAPIDPTMKYWKTLAETSPPEFLYFLKSGMVVVSLWLLVPRNGDW